MFHVEVDWRFGVHPLIIQYIESLGIPDELIKVVSETEVIILNNASQEIHGP